MTTIIKQNKMSYYPNAGYLEIILGSMYSGKTSRLVEIYKQYKFCNISVQVINHSIDARYDNIGDDVCHQIFYMSTHDKVKIPCIKTEKLLNLQAIDSDVVLINEGQFFPDLEEFVKLLLARGVKVYVCGLDGDFERKKFGQILDIIPLCDKITKLTSLCAICKNGTSGIFSKRITAEKEQTVVGTDNYIPVCRICYDN
jgi:thymidine kinase